jgi:hydroxypyruvate reductase
MADAAIKAAMPDASMLSLLPPRPRGRTVVVGAGKAAGAMAKLLEDGWDGPLTGLVVTRYGHGLPTKRIEVVEAAHPIPDEAGQRAALEILTLVQGLGPDDLVICLLSGGGSALLAAPAPGLALADKQEVTRSLLKSGATIAEINCVRKHLSAIKGGRLALACHPAAVVTLAISDVVGDDAAVIASGPTVGDPTTMDDAKAVLDRYGIPAPDALAETPKAGDPRLAGSHYHLVATPAQALAAAADEARRLGYAPVMLGDRLEGEARDLAAQMADRVRQGPAGPYVLLSGGEATVTVTGKGQGGPNTEFCLALALEGPPGAYALALDTDGIDGTMDNAGAVVTPTSLARARALGLDGPALLADNDSYRFFQALGDLVLTGPTRTNVNDFRAILVP